MPSIVARKITKKRFKGLDKPPKYSSPTVQYTYERDYTFQRDQQVSLGTLNGRITIPYQGYDKHLALIRHGASIGDAKLWYDKPKKTFYLLVSLEIEVPEPTYEQLQRSGRRRCRYSLSGSDFYLRQARRHSIQGNEFDIRANHYARLRKRLQKKGTRGAKRRLKRIEQRERRLKMQANHIIAKQIIKQHPHALHRTRTVHRHPRTNEAHETQTQEERQRHRARLTKGAQSQSCLFTMVLCRTACASSATKRSFQDHKLSRSMRIIPQKPVLSVGIPLMRTAHSKGLLFVCQNPMSATRCTLIWLARGILP